RVHSGGSALWSTSKPGGMSTWRVTPVASKVLMFCTVNSYQRTPRRPFASDVSLSVRSVSTTFCCGGLAGPERPGRPATRPACPGGPARYGERADEVAQDHDLLVPAFLGSDDARPRAGPREHGRPEWLPGDRHPRAASAHGEHADGEGPVAAADRHRQVAALA